MKDNETIPADAPTPILEVSNVSKTYPGGTQALIDVDLSVRAGEIVCLLGPSGCGKTTLLRVVAGLETPDRGHITHQGRDLVHVPPHQRGFGFMFQDFALFPHRTVAENVAFGLRMARVPRVEQDRRVAAMLELVNLPGYGKRTIFELSGGERQRVALARSLAPQPALLMLDEPLGSLDRALREELVDELRTILKQLEVTALYVTHDQDEALALGDRLVIMQRGRIEQTGTPSEVYAHPATPFAARFLGFTNLLPAQRADGGVQSAIGFFPLVPPVKPDAFTLLLRPEAARLAPPTSKNEPQKTPGFHAWGHATDTVLLQGKLLTTTYQGSSYRVVLEVAPRFKSLGASGAPFTMQFELPAFQRSEADGTLQPLQLPNAGASIQLLIYTNLATILPYPSTTT